jgi:hypothetical protein
MALLTSHSRKHARRRRLFSQTPSEVPQASRAQETLSDNVAVPAAIFLPFWQGGPVPDVKIGKAGALLMRQNLKCNTPLRLPRCVVAFGFSPPPRSRHNLLSIKHLRPVA